MATQLRDLGRELPDCPARYHGTLSARTKAGCACPAAIQERAAYDRRRGVTSPRRNDIDQQAITYAIAGDFPARKLTTAERIRVVTHLAAVEHLTDSDIAIRLRWSDCGRRGQNAVCKFRRRYGIPSGVPIGARYWTQVAA